MKQVNDLREFVKNFFSNLGADIKNENSLLIISKVPSDFEAFCGKKSPYKLSFDKIEDDSVDFITKGSVMLKAIMSYLESRGQTTLIKIDFDRDYKTELEEYFILMNSKIESFNKKPAFHSFARFSISTVLQYLNEKEQIDNNICVDNSQVVNFNLDKYKTLPGKKEELPKKDFKQDYEIAKVELKNLTKKRVEETAKNLGDKLDKEILRIKKHYDKQREEFELNLKKLLEQRKNLELQFKKSKDPSIEEKISKVSDSIKIIENSDTLKTLQKEEAFFIADEKQKHSLRVINKLINTSIIYYPIFTFDFILHSKESARKVEIIYDPLKDILLKSVFCESCKKEIREVYICSSGHLSCSNCREQCAICDSSLCLSCIKKRCDYCGKKLCKTCAFKCSSCYKNICKNHATTNYADGKNYCTKCLVQCENCFKYTNKSRIKSINDKKMCEKCYRTSITLKS